jgi:predicted RNA-binding Zn ribbon-like protein
MAEAGSRQTEWVDGFLFVGNHLALDFLNTKPILDGQPTELLRDGAALERWLMASGIVRSRTARALVRGWRSSPAAQSIVQELIAFRERLRAAVLRLESGSPPKDAFLSELNLLLREHPQPVHLGKANSKVVLNLLFEPRTPEDVWAPIVAATAQLLAEGDSSRLRKCESDACVVHFYDISGAA